jgi:hypothetical protein
MRRIVCVITATILSVFLMLWLVNGASSIVAAPSEEETPDHLPTSIELEILEAAGDPVSPPISPSVVSAAANLTDVYIMPDYTTVTDLLPRVIITKGSDELAPGYYFVTTFQVGTPVTPTKSMMIVNNKAQLVYYQQDPINRGVVTNQS